MAVQVEEDNVDKIKPIGLESNNEAAATVQLPDTAIHDDSGHESTMSTPDLPSTPQEECSLPPGKNIFFYNYYKFKETKIMMDIQTAFFIFEL